eukprot:14362982-Heterocapsa_arctica.AAC.1
MRIELRGRRAGQLGYLDLRQEVFAPGEQEPDAGAGVRLPPAPRPPPPVATPPSVATPSSGGGSVPIPMDTSSRGTRMREDDGGNNIDSDDSKRQRPAGAGEAE